MGTVDEGIKKEAEQIIKAFEKCIDDRERESYLESFYSDMALIEYVLNELINMRRKHGSQNHT